MSSSDAQTLVRQLTDNPEVLESMQHMLSLLRANPPKSSHSNSAAPPLTSSQRCTAAVPPGGRPPRTGYEDDTLISASQRQLNYSSHHYNLPSEQESPPRTYSSESLDDGRGSRAYSRTADTSVPVPHQQQQQHQRQQQQQHHHDGAAEDEHGRRTTSASARGTRRSAQHTSVTRGGYSAVGSGVGSASQPVESAELAAAQRRIAELEKELQRTAQRVDQLSDVVHRQKDELQEAQDRHALELEETRQAYDAVVRRKDEVQEEALKQLMRSRQLMVSASKYEAVVAAKKREKENALHNSIGGGSGSGAGLTMSATAVNARNTLPGGTSSTSAVKRERPDEADDGDDEYLSAATLKNKNNNNNNNYFYTPQQDSPPSKRTASETWGTPVSRGRGRPRRDPQPLQSAQAASAAKSYRKTESPEFITSPTPVGKASTALVGGARTQSRSARKRRTPRTPSLTNADRIAAAAAAAAASSSKRGAPEYSTSFKLDSPTPVVSTTWTAGRSATTSRTPPPPPPPPVPLGTAATLSPITRSGQQQQQHQGGGGGGGSALTKPPLQQRSAGRLPPPAPAATPQLHIARAVPSTRSGTSSVVQDGPTRSPSPVNPKRGNAGPRRFVFTGLKDDEPQRLARAIAAVGDDGAVVASELDEVPPALTTHIVLRGTPRSVKALCGVVSSKWLVSPEYILNSAESGFWLDEVDEGGMRIFPPPLQGQRFLVTMEHDGIRRKLAQVIEYGGGEVLPVQSGGKVAQDVVVITSGDDLLRYATEGHG